MPIPIPSNYNITIKHDFFPISGNMPGMNSSKDYYSIGYVISGDRKSITTSTISEYHSGQIGMIGPGILHRTVALSNIPYERILIKYTYKMAKPFISLVGLSVFNQLYEEHIHSFSSQTQNKIKTMMLDMVDVFNNYNQFSEYILQNMLTRLLLTIMLNRKCENISIIRFPFENKQIMSALLYIETHYYHNLMISEVAKHVNLSNSYFSYLFKKMIGNTYTAYLNQVRLQHALHLLINSSDSIGEIAAKCGFANANYFCDVFKKKYNISPSYYRKEINSQLLVH